MADEGSVSVLSLVITEFSEPILHVQLRVIVGVVIGIVRDVLLTGLKKFASLLQSFFPPHDFTSEITKVGLEKVCWPGLGQNVKNICEKAARESCQIVVCPKYKYIIGNIRFVYHTHIH